MSGRVDTGTDAAFLAWAGRRLVAVGSDGRVAGARVPTPVESVVSGERAVVLSRESLAFVSENGAVRQVPLPGVVHGGLAASSRAAYVADAGGVLEVTPDGVVTRRLATARLAKGSGPYRTAALIGDTLVVAGCDKATHSGCAQPSGLRLIDTRTWFSRTLDARASWFKRAGRHIVVERDGLRVYTTDGFLRIHAFKGRDGRRPGQRHARLRAHRRRRREPHSGDRPAHRQDTNAPGAGAVPAVRWLPLLAVALVACGGSEPPPATPDAGTALAGSGRVRRRARRLARRLRPRRRPHPPAHEGQARRVLAELVGRPDRLPREPAARRRRRHLADARDGTGKRNLTRSPDVPDWSPAFSPDGRTIAYMSAHELWLMDADGGNQRQLTRAGELSEYPSWSPDGRALAFSGHRGGDFEVLRIDAAGGEERNLTNTPGDDKWPAWSPDGKQIAYISDDDVYVMAADGSGPRNVSKTPNLYENHPSWTPDGRLTFLQHGESGPVHVRVVDHRSYDLPIDAVFVYDWR